MTASTRHKLVIAGGRKFARMADGNYHLDMVDGAFERLDKLAEKLGGPDNIEVIEGGAEGADRVGRWWATERGIPYETFEADWDKHGKRAGFIRNAEMAEVGTHLVAFWNGNSVGTKMMIDLARRKGIKTAVIGYTGA